MFRRFGIIAEDESVVVELEFNSDFLKFVQSGFFANIEKSKRVL